MRPCGGVRPSASNLAATINVVSTEHGLKCVAGPLPGPGS